MLAKAQENNRIGFSDDPLKEHRLLRALCKSFQAAIINWTNAHLPQKDKSNASVVDWSNFAAS